MTGIPPAWTSDPNSTKGGGSEAPGAVVVLGSGAVGGLLAGLLTREGPGCVVVGTQPTVDQLTSQGLRVDSDRFGDWTATVDARTTVPTGAEVLLTIKAPHLPTVLPTLIRARPRRVLALLNGIEHGYQIRHHLAETEVSCGSITVVAHRLSRHEVRHEGELLTIHTPRNCEEWPVLQGLRAAGITVTAAGTEKDVLWTKFRFLAAMAILTAHSEGPIGQVLTKDPDAVRAVATEIALVATAEGLPTTNDDILTRLHAFHPEARSSLQRDLAADSPSELDAIAGAFLRAAKRHHIPTPATAHLRDARSSPTRHERSHHC